MESIFTPVVIGSSVITAICVFYVTQIRKKGLLDGPEKQRSGLAEAMLDEQMQNGLVRGYDQLLNIDNIRTADQIQTPALDKIPFNGNIIQYQSALLNNTKSSYKHPATTADQALIGYYVPSREELDSSERYNRDY